jgi:hypothetical protein
MVGICASCHSFASSIRFTHLPSTHHLLLSQVSGILNGSRVRIGTFMGLKGGSEGVSVYHNKHTTVVFAGLWFAGSHHLGVLTKTKHDGQQVEEFIDYRYLSYADRLKDNFEQQSEKASKAAAIKARAFAAEAKFASIMDDAPREVRCAWLAAGSPVAAAPSTIAAVTAAATTVAAATAAATTVAAAAAAAAAAVTPTTAIPAAPFAAPPTVAAAATATPTVGAPVATAPTVAAAAAAAAATPTTATPTAPFAAPPTVAAAVDEDPPYVPSVGNDAQSWYARMKQGVVNADVTTTPATTVAVPVEQPQKKQKVRSTHTSTPGPLCGIGTV